MQHRTIVVGNGNVGVSLCAHLARRGASIATVVRQPAAEEPPWPRYTFSELDRVRATEHDLVLLAVSDDAIAEVSTSLAGTLPPTLSIAHLSGTTPVDAIDPHFPHRGVLWPLQTFHHRAGPVRWTEEVPLLYAGHTATVRDRLTTFGHAYGHQVQQTTLEQRQHLHLAAVFANNFVNHCYQLAYEVCQEGGTDFELLLPLIRRTAAIQTGAEPARLQTGPAARGDVGTQRRHAELFGARSRVGGLYEQLSAAIGATAEAKSG